jgi:hypothetical protein
MIAQTVVHKQYHSAQARFVGPLLGRLLDREFPKLMGPILRDRLVEELLALIESVMLPKDYVSPGQVVWCAVDKHTRADSPKLRLVPVVLTLIDEQDCLKLSTGTPMRDIASNAIARIMNEAYAQGALLSMRDIELLSWRSRGNLTETRKRYEKNHGAVLPHTGTLHDMGSCLTHKDVIVRKVVVEKKSPQLVARETNHSLPAVERYLNDFRRVQHCYEKEQSVDFIVAATAIAKHVVLQYIDIIKNLNS